MEGLKAVPCLFLFLAFQLLHGLASPDTVPAFLWSPQNYDQLNHAVKEVISYQTISPKELAQSVLSEGRWSDLLCSGKRFEYSVDIALVFIGRKMRTSDISKRTSTSDSSLVDLLKASFSSSNVSMAFPYVTVSDGKEKLVNCLISEFAEHCGNNLNVGQIAYMGSCSIDIKEAKKLEDLDSLNEFLSSKMTPATEGKTKLVVFCSGLPEDLEAFQSDGDMLSKLVIYLEQLGAKYTALYASDPYRSGQFTTYTVSERFLLQEAVGNGSLNYTICDGVCQIKSSLLEGLFVGIVLLIILISGLCCMMGIDTPSRFEVPQDS